MTDEEKVAALFDLAESRLEREREQLKSIQNMNTPAWGMCIGAIEAWQEVLGALTGETLR